MISESLYFGKTAFADYLIGVTGFEPATSWSQTKRSTKLSYTPNIQWNLINQIFCHELL